MDRPLDEKRKNKMPAGKISKIKKACRISDEAFSFIKENIKVGQTEKEIRELVNSFIRKQSAKLSFRTIIGSGPNSANIHNRSTERKIKAGEPIVLDFGAKVDGYCSDLTRTVFLKRAPKKFGKILKIVLKAQKKALKTIEKERSAYKVDKSARDIIEKSGFGKEFFHTLGHGLGLKAHEGLRIGPKSKSILKKGDIVTIEPGIYLKGKGGVRIEDDVLIKSKGIEILTKSPKGFKKSIIK